MTEASNNNQTFELPDLGEGLQSAEIVAWHVAVGDHFVAEQPLVSIEPAAQSGKIKATLPARALAKKLEVDLAMIQEKQTNEQAPIRR